MKTTFSKIEGNQPSTNFFRTELKTPSTKSTSSTNFFRIEKPPSTFFKTEPKSSTNFFRTDFKSSTETTNFFKISEKPSNFFKTEPKSSTNFFKRLADIQQQKEKIKTQSQIIDEVVNTIMNVKLSKEEKINAVSDLLIEESKKRTNLNYLWEWVSSSSRHILLNVAIRTAIVIVFGSIYAYWNGFTFLQFFNALLATGIYGVMNIGSVLYSVGVSGGFSIALNSFNAAGGMKKLVEVARTNRHLKTVLDTKIPTSYLETILRSVGVDAKNTQVKDLIPWTTSFILSGILQYVNGGNLYTLLGTNILLPIGMKTVPKLYGYGKEKYQQLKEKILTPAEEKQIISELIDQAEHMKDFTASTIIDPSTDNISEKIVDEIIRIDNPEIKYIPPPTITKEENLKMKEEAEEEADFSTTEKLKQYNESIDSKKISASKRNKEYRDELMFKKEDLSLKLSTLKNHVKNAYMSLQSDPQKVEKPSLITTKKKKRVFSEPQEIKTESPQESVEESPKINVDDPQQLQLYFLIEEQKLLEDIRKQENDLELIISKSGKFEIGNINRKKLILEKSKEKLDNLRKSLNDIEGIQQLSEKISFITDEVTTLEKDILDIEEKYAKSKAKLIVDDFNQQKSEQAKYYKKLSEKVIEKEVNVTLPTTSVGDTSSSLVSSFLKTNKKMLMAGIAGTLILGTAIAGGNVDAYSEVMKDLTGKYAAVAFAGVKKVMSFDMARTYVARKLLSFFGIEYVINKFARFLAPGTIKELRNLSEALKVEKDESAIRSMYNKIFGLIVGGYYSAKTLQSYTKSELEAIFKSHHPRHNPKSLGRKELINEIIRAQSKRMSLVSDMFTKVVSEGVNSLAAIATQRYAGELNEYMGNYSKEETMKKIAELENIKKRMDEMKRIPTTGEDIDKKRDAIFDMLKLKSLQEMIDRSTGEGGIYTGTGTKIEDVGLPVGVLPPTYTQPVIQPTTPRFDIGELQPTLGPQPQSPEEYMKELLNIQPTTPRFDIGELQPTLGPHLQTPEEYMKEISKISFETTPRFDIGELQPTLGPQLPPPGEYIRKLTESSPRFDIRDQLRPTLGPVIREHATLSQEDEEYIRKQLGGKTETILRKLLKTAAGTAATGIAGEWVKTGYLMANVVGGAVKDIRKIQKIMEVIDNLENGEKIEFPKDDLIDQMLNIPTAEAITEKVMNMVTDENFQMIDTGEVIIECLTNKLRYGWEAERFWEEVESRLIADYKSMGEDLQRQYGYSFTYRAALNAANAAILAGKAMNYLPSNPDISSLRDYFGY